jgi:hypothetical protein
LFPSACRCCLCFLVRRGTTGPNCCSISDCPHRNALLALQQLYEVSEWVVCPPRIRLPFITFVPKCPSYVHVNKGPCFIFAVRWHQLENSHELWFGNLAQQFRIFPPIHNATCTPQNIPFRLYRIQVTTRSNYSAVNDQRGECGGRRCPSVTSRRIELCTSAWEALTLITATRYTGSNSHVALWSREQSNWVHGLYCTHHYKAGNGHWAVINEHGVISKALFNEFHTSVLCNWVFLIIFESGVHHMNTCTDVKFRHSKISNPLTSVVSQRSVIPARCQFSTHKTLVHRCLVLTLTLVQCCLVFNTKARAMLPRGNTDRTQTGTTRKKKVEEHRSSTGQGCVSGLTGCWATWYWAPLNRLKRATRPGWRRLMSALLQLTTPPAVTVSSDALCISPSPIHVHSCFMEDGTTISRPVQLECNSWVSSAPEYGQIGQRFL